MAKLQVGETAKILTGELIDCVGKVLEINHGANEATIRLDGSTKLVMSLDDLELSED